MVKGSFGSRLGKKFIAKVAQDVAGDVGDVVSGVYGPYRAARRLYSRLRGRGAYSVVPPAQYRMRVPDGSQSVVDGVPATYSPDWVAMRGAQGRSQARFFKAVPLGGRGGMRGVKKHCASCTC